jgi:hypothetical protein
MQGLGGLLIDRIDGSYDNCVGWVTDPVPANPSDFPRPSSGNGWASFPRTAHLMIFRKMMYIRALHYGLKTPMITVVPAFLQTNATDFVVERHITTT